MVDSSRTRALEMVSAAAAAAAAATSDCLPMAYSCTFVSAPAIARFAEAASCAATCLRILRERFKVQGSGFRVSCFRV